MFQIAEIKYIKVFDNYFASDRLKIVLENTIKALN